MSIKSQFSKNSEYDGIMKKKAKRLFNLMNNEATLIVSKCFASM